MNDNTGDYFEFEIWYFLLNQHDYAGIEIKRLSIESLFFLDKS
jgi:hypothetical protein